MRVRESFTVAAGLVRKAPLVYFTAALLISLITVFCSLPPGLKPFGNRTDRNILYGLIAFANLLTILFYGFISAHAWSQLSGVRPRLLESMQTAGKRFFPVLGSLAVPLLAFVVSAVPMWFVLQLGVLEFVSDFPKHLVPMTHKMFSMILAAFIAKEYMFMLPIAVNAGWGSPNPAHQSRQLVAGSRATAYLLCLAYAVSVSGILLLESVANPEAHIRFSVWAATTEDYAVRIAFSFMANALSAFWVVFITVMSRRTPS